MKTLAAIARWAVCRLAPALVLAVLPAKASAFDLDPSEIRGKSSKEPVTVLQNRYFLKTFRPEFGFLVGQITDEAYLETQYFGARSGLFFNEWLGVEVQMAKTRVSDSADRKALEKIEYPTLPEDQRNGENAVPTTISSEDLVTVSPEPEVNAIHSFTDFNAIAAPFYGKLNFIDKWIIYTDLYVTAGLARMETDQGDKSAVTLGIGERFYIGKAWSFRVDVRDRMFNETRAGEQSRRNSYSLDLGASYFLN